MISRQPKIHVAFRITAAVTVVFWLLAASYCSIEHLFGDDHHHAEASASKTGAHHDDGHSDEAEAAEHAQAESSHSHGSDQSSGDSHPHDGDDDVCCSTLHATAQAAELLIIAKPVLQPLNLLTAVLPARDSIKAASESKPDRQAKSSEWAFTHGVCLDAANRSHAPPLFI